MLGEKCYPNLKAIPDAVDIVDVFRKPEDCVPIAHDAIAIGAKVFWMQL
ncbi:MAG: CoA-binding protein, partial [Burkholderiaceae bacterium]